MPILDSLQRPLRDLRISVTDRCNFRCRYCMPAEVFDTNYPFLSRDDVLNFEEIFRVAKVAAALGVKKIRLTGGEPLMRRNLPELIRMLKSIDGLEDLAMTTNAALLASKAQELKEAGLDRITISLDALSPDTFASMNGIGAKPEKVIAGFRAARTAGIPVKLNSVIQKGVNEDEVLPLIHFAREQETPLRFIEYMDVGETNKWQLKEVVCSADILKLVNSHFSIKAAAQSYRGETAKRFLFEDGKGEIGFISSVTQPFCGDCTRARLSADGQMFTCLFAQKGHQIKGILRETADDQLLTQTLSGIWQTRKDQYSTDRSNTEQTDEPLTSQKPEMSFIGG